MTVDYTVEKYTFIPQKFDASF